MRIILSAVFIMPLIVACHIDPLGGGTNDLGSVSSQVCNDGDFGPVPSSTPRPKKRASKLYVTEDYKNSLQQKDGRLWLNNSIKFAGLIDLDCWQKNPNLDISRISDVNLSRVQVVAQRPRQTKLFPISFTLTQQITYDDFERTVNGDKCIVTMGINTPFQKDVVPNDPQFSDLGHMEFLGAPTAWDVFFHPTTGISQVIRVAIVDDGGDTDHPDLAANTWVNGGEVAGNATDDDANGYTDDVNGYNFVTDIGDPNHEAGNQHGTTVAGFTGARYNNGVGITGVMGQFIELMYLNVGGPTATIDRAASYEAITYAINNGADVLNLSFGGLGEDPTMELLLGQAVTAGAVVIVSSGNESLNLNASIFRTPASYGAQFQGVITVGATESDTGRLTAFSNYGSNFVEMSAPGAESFSTGVLTTIPGSDPVNSYDEVFGTSFSAPIVSGAAAIALGLMRSRGQSPTPAEIETLLKGSSDQNQILSGLVQGCYSLNLETLSTQIQ